MIGDIDASDFTTLGIELDAVVAETHAATRGVFREAAHELKTTWRANAVETSGQHGKHYPNAITWEEKVGTSLDFEVGPESHRPQGDMGPGFEFGSINQPPHLDGQRAADQVLPNLERRAALAAEDVFGGA